MIRLIFHSIKFKRIVVVSVVYNKLKKVIVKQRKEHFNRAKVLKRVKIGALEEKKIF